MRTITTIMLANKFHPPCDAISPGVRAPWATARAALCPTIPPGTGGVQYAFTLPVLFE